MPDAGLTLLSHGLSSNAWLVTDEETGRELVLRVALTPAARSTYQREHAVLARVLNTLDQADSSALRVPRPLNGHWTLESSSAVNFSVTERLGGRGLALAHAAEAAEAIGRALRTLHEVDVRGLGLPDSTRSWPFDDTPVKPTLASQLTPWAHDIQQAAATPPRVLVHRDLHEENILWPLADHPDGSRVGFVDFGMASVGAGGWDFAALAYFLSWRVAAIALTSYLPDRDLRGVTCQTQLLALSFAHYRLVTAEDNDEIPHAIAFINETLSWLEHRRGGHDGSTPAGRTASRPRPDRSDLGE